MSGLLQRPLTAVDEGRRFEWRALRLLGYLSQVAFVSWAVAAACVSTDTQIHDDFWWPKIEYPMWAMLGFHALYYLYILARKIRVSLLAFVVTLVLWGNAVIWCWVYMGAEFGISVALGGAVYVCSALTWSGATIRILALTKGSSRSAIVLLGLATPLAVCGLIYGGWWSWQIRDNYYHRCLPVSGMALIAASSVILILAAAVSLRTYRSAKQILANVRP